MAAARPTYGQTKWAMHTRFNKGDPLMPALYALGQHRALQVAKAQLLPDELLVAFLDDVYALCAPERVSAVYAALEEVLATS